MTAVAPHVGAAVQRLDVGAWDLIAGQDSA